MTQADLILAVLFFVAAVLYSSVGHAGASGYLAAMALMAVAPPVMKPTALVTNVLVASIASIRYLRAGCFSWAVAWPFIISAAPAAFVGGVLQLHGQLYRSLVAVVLIISAIKLAYTARSVARLPEQSRRPLVPVAVIAGVAIGLLAGLTGTGGGIFLSPLLLFLGWAGTRQTLGITAVFILANSIMGLAGNILSLGDLPSALWLWALAAGVGGVIGSYLGSRLLPLGVLRLLLAVVLLVASGKLFWP